MSPRLTRGPVVPRRKLTKSQQMARVRSRDTSLEVQLRQYLWRRGFRYRLQPKLPGTPDLVLVTPKIAVFVDGCFWHGCPDHYSRPATNIGFWDAKLERNRARDQRVDAELRALGWRVLRVWEHELVNDLPKVAAKLRSLLRRPSR